MMTELRDSLRRELLLAWTGIQFLYDKLKTEASFVTSR